MDYTKSKWHNHNGIIETHYSPDGHVIAMMNNVGDKVEADGNLTAAAPEMYEALKELMERVNGGIRFPLMSTVNKANEAIAKAEGK